MSDSKVIITMRRMQWQRAKGELLAILEAYWPEYRHDGTEIDEGFKTVKTQITDFIKDFEDNF